jgi:carbon monoxide dehydrogenase subunit G
MELIGEQMIAQTRDKVWAALNDTEILRGCITGCETIEMIGENEYKVGLFAAVGPLKARFTGKMTMLDVLPPDSYALNFEGAGGIAGFAKGNAAIKLMAEGDATRLSYVVKVTVGGKLAQIGSRLIDGVAKKMSDAFFAAFNARIGNPAATTAGADTK